MHVPRNGRRRKRKCIAAPDLKHNPKCLIRIEAFDGYTFDEGQRQVARADRLRVLKS
jgi:hypothetical protein